MATSITFNTLQRRELFSLYFCKCYATPLRISHSSHLLITFPSPKHALTPKVSSFFTVKPPLIAVINPGFSSLNCNFSAKSVEFRDYSENSGSGQSIFHSNYGKKDGILKDKNGRKLVDSVKSRKSGESVDLWKRNEKGDVNSSERDERLGFNRGRNWDNNNGGSSSSSSSSSRGEYGSRDNGRIDFGERIERGKDVYSSSDRRLGFDNRRIWVNKNGDGGWSREVGSENNGKLGGRGDYEKGGRGNGVLLSKSSGGKERRRMEGISGGVVIDDGNRGQKGYGVSSRRRVEGNQSARIGLNGNVHGENIKEKNSNGNGKVKKKEKVSKKNKVDAPEFQLRIGLDMCSKKGDVMGAISLYDRAVEEGVKIGQHQYTVLLYLCSSAAMGVIRPAKSGSGRRSLNKVASHDLDGPDDSEEEEEEEDDDTESLDDEGLSVKDETENLVNEIKVSDDVKKYALERGFEVYDRMCLEKVEVNEAALTSVARMAMAMGNGDMAFDMVKQMQSMGISPKLRSYSPALSVFSSNGELDKAFAVEKHMLENGVYPEEPELEALLRVSVQSGKADKVYYILHKLRTSVRSVSPSTAELIEKWFRSRESSRVGKRKWDVDMLAQTMENVGGGWHGQGWLGSGKWSVARTSVGANGLCKCCGEKLAMIDLDPEETEKFAESVASIAIKRDRNSSFQKFQRWLDYYGPFEAVVDAANVGLFSQRTFKPSKVNAVVNGIRQLLPSKKWPLIILHNKRVTGSKMEQPVNRALVDRWRNADALYPTPTGSNDDWYWLYAAIKFKCLLVTNDEMRDHTFQLLGNDFFPKWKERHQVRFNFTEIGPVFHMPPPCSVVIQESDRGFWHIPIASEHQSEGERIWLCISRPKTLVTQMDPSIMCLSNSRLRLLRSQAT